MANGTHDKVQELQTKLYQAAKRSPTRRFHALYDKVHRWDFLCKAWVDVASNDGAPGVDGVSIAQIEEGGDVSQLQVDQTESQLLQGRSTVLQEEVDYRDALVRFKLQLGLPPNVPLELDDAPLRPLVAPAAVGRTVQHAAQDAARQRAPGQNADAVLLAGG